MKRMAAVVMTASGFRILISYMSQRMLISTSLKKYDMMN